MTYRRRKAGPLLNRDWYSSGPASVSDRAALFTGPQGCIASGDVNVDPVDSG